MGAVLRMKQEHDAGELVRARLAGFVRNLRDNGFLVGLSETRDALKIVAGPDTTRVSLLRPAFRALFCARPSDWERFDDIFNAYWLGHGMKSVVHVSGEPPKASTSLRKAGDGAPSLGKPGTPDRTERGEGKEHDNPADGRGRREGASTTPIPHRWRKRIASPSAFRARCARVLRVGKGLAAPAHGLIYAAPSIAALLQAARLLSSSTGIGLISLCGLWCCLMRRVR